MSDPASPEPRRGVRRWLVLLVVVPPLLFLLALTVLLLSPGLQSRLLEAARPAAAEAGLHWQAEQLRLNLLRGVTADELELRLEAPQAVTGQIRIDTLNLQWRLGRLLRRQVVIPELLLHGLHGTLYLQADTEAEAPDKPMAPAEADDGALDLAPLFEALRDLPVAVELRRLSLRNLNPVIDMEQRSGETFARSRVRLQDAHLEGGVAAGPDELALRWQLELPLRWQHTEQGPDLLRTGQGELHARQHGRLDLRLDHNEPGQTWAGLLRLDPQHLQIGPTRWFEQTDEEASELRLAGLQLQAPVQAYRDAAPAHRGPVVAALAPFGLSTTGALDLAPIEISATSPGRAVESTRLARFDLQWQAALTAATPARAEAVATAQLALALARLQQVADAPLLSLDALQLELVLLGDDPANVEAAWKLQLEALEQPDLRAGQLTAEGHSRIRQHEAFHSLSATAPGLWQDSLLRPADLWLSLATTHAWPEPLPLTRPTTLALALRLDDLLDAAFDLEITEVATGAGGRGQLLGKLRLRAEPELDTLIEGSSDLRTLGRMDLQLDGRIDLGWPTGTLSEVDWGDLHSLQVDTDWTGSLRLDATGIAEPQLRISEMLASRLQLKLDGGRVDLSLQAELPQVELPETAELHAMRMDTRIRLADLDRTDDVDLDTDLEVARIVPLGDLATLLPAGGPLAAWLRDWTARIRLRQRAPDRVYVDRIEMRLADPLLRFEGQGDFRLSGDGDLSGHMQIDLPDIPDGDLRSRGRVELPFSLAVHEAREFSLRADPRFADVHLETDELRVVALDGHMAIHQDLRLHDDGRISFQHLEQPNPFRRVDYPTIAPFLGDPPTLHMAALQLGGLEITDFAASPEIRQNLLIGVDESRFGWLGGWVVGRMFVDMNPARPVFGMLGRFSHLDPNRLLPPRRRGAVTDSGEIAGRAAFAFDLRRRLAEGRLDITSIGRPQLLRLLDVMDPDFEDPQINLARRGLAVAWPRAVHIEMDRGEMDLAIALGGLTRQTLRIRGVPLSPLIEAWAGETLQELETGFAGEEEP